jgi:hypothetical protein
MFRKALFPLTAILLGTAAGTAAAEDAAIKSMTYSTAAVPGFNEINVYSSDGVQWDTFYGPPLKFTAIGAVDTRFPGYIDSMGIFLGYCFNTGCSGYPLLFLRSNVLERDMLLNRQIEAYVEDIPISDDNGIAVNPLGDQILSLCNETMGPSGPVNDHSFGIGVWTSMSVNTRRATQIPTDTFGQNEYDGPPWPDYNGGDATAQDTFIATVHCHAYDDDLDDVPNQDFYVEDVQLFLSTFSNEYTQPDPDTQCKKGRILVRVRTNQAGPVAMKLKKGGDVQAGEEFIETWSSHVGSGVYEAEVIRWVSVMQTSDLDAFVEVNSANGWLPDGWETIRLECITDTPDFAPNPSPDDNPGRDPTGGYKRP